jgi:hypothetical protein
VVAVGVASSIANGGDRPSGGGSVSSGSGGNGSAGNWATDDDDNIDKGGGSSSGSSGGSGGRRPVASSGGGSSSGNSGGGYTRNEGDRPSSSGGGGYSTSTTTSTTTTVDSGDAPQRTRVAAATPAATSAPIASPSKLGGGACQGMWVGTVEIPTDQPGALSLTGLGGEAIVAKDGTVTLDCSKKGDPETIALANGATCLGNWTGSVMIPTNTEGDLRISGLGTVTVTAERTLLLDCGTFQQ